MLAFCFAAVSGKPDRLPCPPPTMSGTSLAASRTLAQPLPRQRLSSKQMSYRHSMGRRCTALRDPRISKSAQQLSFVAVGPKGCFVPSTVYRGSLDNVSFRAIATVAWMSNMKAKAVSPHCIRQADRLLTPYRGLTAAHAVFRIADMTSTNSCCHFGSDTDCRYSGSDRGRHVE